MSDFKKGQLVAVRDADGQDWSLRVYDHASPEGQHFCRGIERRTPPCWWSQVESAEVIWPDVFLASDKVLIEHLEENRDRLHKKIDEVAEGLTTAYLAGFTDGEQGRKECDRMKARADRIVAENKEMQRQIDYLCFTAGQSQCPPKKRPDCQHKGERDELFCAMCWLFASKKAVEEKTDG